MIELCPKQNLLEEKIELGFTVHEIEFNSKCEILCYSNIFQTNII